MLTSANFMMAYGSLENRYSAKSSLLAISHIYVLGRFTPCDLLRVFCVISDFSLKAQDNIGEVSIALKLVTFLFHTAYGQRDIWNTKAMAFRWSVKMDWFGHLPALSMAC